MTKRRLLPLLLLTMLVAALSAAPSAMAIIPPTTTITSPADGTWVLSNDNASAAKISISGTTTGSIGAVDIRCYGQIDGNYGNLVTGVPVDGSGNFASNNVSVAPAVGRSCWLVAVTAGSTPAMPNSNNHGVRLTVNETGDNSSSGHPTDFYDYAGQTDGGWGYDSVGSCGISYGQLNDKTYNFATAYTFDCNHYFDDYVPSSGAPTISGVQVNGQNAYAPSDFGGSGAGVGGGFPLLTHTFAVDPTTHDMTIHETDGFSVCPNNVVAPSGANCAVASASGVVLNRSIVQDHAGLVSHVTDVYTNTTGAPVSLNLAYKQTHFFGLNIETTTASFLFPNGTTVANATPFTTVNGPFASPGTIYGSSSAALDGNTGTGRNALTLFPSADSAVFESSTYFYLQYKNRTIPPGGTYKIDGVFSQSYSVSQLSSLVTEANNLITPKPTFGAKTKSSLKLDKKKRHIAYVSGQSVLCPAFGQACAISGALTARVKLPAKHVKKGAKKPKAKYKIYTLGKLSATGQPGTTTALKLTLGSKAVGLFKKYGKLKTTLVVNVNAGPYSAASNSFAAKLKSPKFPKPKKH